MLALRLVTLKRGPAVVANCLLVSLGVSTAPLVRRSKKQNNHGAVRSPTYSGAGSWCVAHRMI
jgi:hypothetical protein